jgi:hypothetical protein
MKSYAIIAQAGVAVATLMPRVTHALAKADPADHDGCLRQIRAATDHARELVTRLELAELELAAALAERGEEAA